MVIGLIFEIDFLREVGYEVGGWVAQRLILEPDSDIILVRRRGG